MFLIKLQEQIFKEKRFFKIKKNKKGKSQKE
jgi:hypothetical protein